MNPNDVWDRAADNLERTYLGIGMATPEARVTDLPGCKVCECALQHAVGNFAIVRSEPGENAERLRLIASKHSNFNVYAVDSGDRTACALRHAGFQKAYRLVAMLAQGIDYPPQTELRRAESEEQMLRVAEFMALQFFFRQNASLRSTIAKATAHSGMDLCEVVESERRIGAVMLSRTPGLLGIYNLCVDIPLRGRGLGTVALRDLLALAAREGGSAVLQCDPSLVRWYRERGFRELGFVDVYSLEST